MGLVLAVFLLALVFGGLGFAVHILWVAAVVLALLWVLGFLLPAEGGRGWYRRGW